MLTPRDLEILEVLREWGALSLPQIARRWFTTEKKARARMAALTARGLCCRRQPDRHQPMVYYTGERWRETLLHQVAVNGVRLELEATGHLIEFIPEVEFRGSKHRADALVTWQPTGGKTITFFLEVDRGTEDRRQIRTKVEGYRAYWRSGRWRVHWPTFPAVVFVAEGDGRCRQLARWVVEAVPPAAIRFLFGLKALKGVVSVAEEGSDRPGTSPAGDAGGSGWPEPGATDREDPDPRRDWAQGAVP